MKLPRQSFLFDFALSFTVLSVASFICWLSLSSTMTTNAPPQQPLTFNDVFEEDDVEEVKESTTVHHIRANSTIMHVKKLLGESPSLGGPWPSLGPCNTFNWCPL